MFAGANLALQAVINTQLRTFVDTPLRSSLVSYLGGTICCAAALLVTRQSLNVISPATATHWWLWTGGLYGLVYLVIVVWLTPRLGTAPVFALVVAGQMLAALAFDQAGWLGGPSRPIDAGKLAGVAALVFGVLMLRR
ncbi:MAG TPA: DMT family transporter [Candidatus Elarobacter sp.]